MLKVVHSFVDSKRMIYFCMACAMLLIVFNIGSAHAANSADIEASVNIKPSLTLNIPTNNITMNLDPATNAFDEKDLTVSIGTNNKYGYQLMVNTLNNTNTLVNVADGTKTIDSLTTSTSPADFPANFWGIRKSTGTTSSGNYGQFTAPYLVSQSSVPVNNDTTTLGFGAKVDYTKESGLYNLNLEFKALPIVTQTYMQNMDTNLCTSDPTVAIDNRDEKPYTIRRLRDGRCWMVENLRFTGMPDDEPNKMTVTPANSNVASATTITYGELATGDDSANSYDDAKLHVGTVDSGVSPIDSSSTAQSNIPTVWYNYVTASAGTVTSSSNNYEAQYDICPAGWRLPSRNEFGGITGMDSVSEFALIEGGTYVSGAPIGTSGYLSSTPFWAMPNQRYRLYFKEGEGLTTVNSYRYGGFYIRCILNEPVDTITTLQQFGAKSSAEKTALKNSMTTGRPYTLRDTRDNQMYTVVKLKDGNVWFANSLNLGGTLLNGNLTSSNTNLSTTVTKATFEGWRKSRGTQTLSSAEYIQLTPGNSTTGSFVDPTSGVAYGTLYNFCAASGGNSTVCADTVASNPGYDICPSGWRLPTGNTNGEFDKLYAQYNSKQSMRNSIVQGGAGFALSGYFDDGPPEYQGSSGYYWSSTRKDNTFMYDLIISGSVNAVGSNGRGNAFAIRCILK